MEADAAVPVLDADSGWSLLLHLARRARVGQPVQKAVYFAQVNGHWHEVSANRGRLCVDPNAPGLLRSEGALCPHVRTMLDIYLPLVVGPRAASLAIGHLGQSLDGRVATPTGVSQFITSREDVVHTHRLRALFDAVLVGVRTVELDDPQLTTRHVPGDHPTRVVLDPHGKLKGRYKVLEDGATPTLICTTREAAPTELRRGHAEWVTLPASTEGFDAHVVLAALRERGLGRVFVEGGGVTVSRFLAMRALDRLHVSVAPMILGSGAPAFVMPPIDRLEEALTPRCRHFALGRDILFDCELSCPTGSDAE